MEDTKWPQNSIGHGTQNIGLEAERVLTTESNGTWNMQKLVDAAPFLPASLRRSNEEGHAIKSKYRHSGPLLRQNPAPGGPPAS
jgi:hypothetical protein